MFLSSKALRLAGVSLAVISGFMTGGIKTAHAGFGWTPPVMAPAPAPTASGMQTIPAPENVGPLTPDPDAPVVSVTPTTPAAAVPVTPVAPEAIELPVPDTSPVPASAAPVAVAPQTDAQEPLVIDNTVPQNIVENVDASAPPANTETTNTVAANDVVPNAAVIEGFGTDIPLVIALRDIVPAGYAYAFAESSMAGTKISWQGGKAWTDVLRDALSTKDMFYTVNGHAIMIYMGSNAQKIVINNDAPKTYSAKEASFDVNAVKEWKVSPGSTLREALGVWCKTAGVKLEWVSPYDFPIGNAFVYNGNFSDAVTSILASFAGETPRPTGKFYPNKEDGTSSLTIN